MPTQSNASFASALPTILGLKANLSKSEMVPIEEVENVEDMAALLSLQGGFVAYDIVGYDFGLFTQGYHSFISWKNGKTIVRVDKVVFFFL